MMGERILVALEEQVECYRRLAKLAAAQHEHVQQSRTEDLLEVLARRQGVLDQIGRIEGKLGPAAQWKRELERLEPAARARAEAMLDETRALLEQITAADRNDALVLQQRKLELGRQIRQATTARQVNRTYAAAAYGSRPASMDVQQ